MPAKRETIIMTGSSGFIGRAVCKAFLGDGYGVVGFDRPGAGEPPANITSVPCDVTVRLLQHNAGSRSMCAGPTHQ
jgi:nucleoside-diphosphate-sugar epimerase